MNATACAKLKMYSDLEHYLSTDPHASLQEREATASEQDTFKVSVQSDSALDHSVQ